MNTISPNQLLGQIKALNAQLDNPVSTAATPTQGSFGGLLRTSINQVNDAQMLATDMKRSFEAGTSDASLAEVMIASQKADLSFRAMTEVRNKLVTAYQDIMNMPV